MQGSIPSGHLLLLGRGVAQDYVEAVKWFRKAAEQNEADAQFNLGICYFIGRGVAKDEAEAVSGIARPPNRMQQRLNFNWATAMPLAKA